MINDGSAFKRPHVLIVTDDQDLREFLAEGLVIGGFWTSTVASALQTLEVFRLRSFDLAIIDLALGGMNALELIKRLRSTSTAVNSEDPRTDIPILALADNPADEHALDALSSGADGLLAPPLELEDLVPQLQDVVRQWRIVHPGRPYADESAQAVHDAPD